jgi:hypothetical protein
MGSHREAHARRLCGFEFGLQEQNYEICSETRWVVDGVVSTGNGVAAADAGEHFPQRVEDAIDRGGGGRGVGGTSENGREPQDCSSSSTSTSPRRASAGGDRYWRFASLHFSRGDSLPTDPMGHSCAADPDPNSIWASRLSSYRNTPRMRYLEQFQVLHPICRHDVLDSG